MDGNGLPCKFFRVGCLVTPLENEKEVHEEICDFRLCQCPYPVRKCPWEGMRLNVAHHLRISHRLSLLQGHEVVFAATDFILRTDHHWLTLQSCFDNHFMLILMKRVTPQGAVRFCAVVQFLGSRTTAGTFNCRMELNRLGRRLEWEGKPRCIYDSLSLADNTTDGFAFNYDTAIQFADLRTLCIKVTISLAA